MTLFAWLSPVHWHNPGRDLARIGIEKRRADVKAVARQIREECGLPPSKALRG